MAKKGLDKKGRVVATELCNLSAIALAECGMTVKTIAKATGLTTSQVMYRYRKAGVSPMDYRRGTGEIASEVLSNYSVKTASEEVHEKLIEDYSGFLGWEPPFKNVKKRSSKNAKKSA